MDLVFEELLLPAPSTPSSLAAPLTRVESGVHADHDAETVTKVAALLVRPLDGGAGTCLALDGERVGGKGSAVAVAVECVPGAARLVVAEGVEKERR